MTTRPKLRRLFASLVALLATCASLHAGAVGWSWVGGLTDKTAVITARLDTDAPAKLVVDGLGSEIAPVFTASTDGGLLHRFVVTGLTADTTAGYRFLTADGTPLDEEARSFQTLPTPGKPASFRFALGSCARGMNSPVFAAAAKQKPRFFLHTGDFHYFDIAENQVSAFRTAYNVHLSAPRLRAFLATTPLFYMWDDHDFGPNDSNVNSPSRDAALQNYRELVPHHPFTSTTQTDGPIDQAFTVGRVRFILSDLRSQRDPDTRRMMSPAQDAWLRTQLLAARDSGFPLIFWVSSVPWNGEPNTWADRWQGYSAHRAEIANFIKEHGLAGKVAILSGDAHMTAIDDGSHSDFATDSGAPVRVFQVGPIANVGSYKGGPYSHGARYKSEDKQFLRHFGIVDINDDGQRIHVKWSGRLGADGEGDQVLESERDAEGPIELEFIVE